MEKNTNFDYAGSFQYKGKKVMFGTDRTTKFIVLKYKKKTLGINPMTFNENVVAKSQFMDKDGDINQQKTDILISLMIEYLESKDIVKL